VTRPRVIRGPLLALAVLLASGAPPAAAAQTDSRLMGAVRLAQEGLSDSARTIVSRLLERTAPTDSLYPEALYTRALVAAEPAAMRSDLQRVAIEYASSNWADDALLRLVLLEYAGNQPESAARHLERFELDHSSSPLYPRAAIWAARIYFGLQRPADGCRWLRTGNERAGDDRELRAELASAARRCADVAVAPARDSVPPRDTAAPPPAIAPPATPAPGTPAPATPSVPASTGPLAPAFRIQIAAVTTAAAAETIATRARAAGIDAVVIREPPHYKVRVGAYRTRAEAAAALPGVRARFRGTPFVVATSE
jgi:cell division septation protein DedD